MAVSSVSVDRDAPTPAAQNPQAPATETPDSKAAAKAAARPKRSLDTDSSTSLNQKDADNVDSAAEFAGELNTNDNIPTQALLQKIESLVVLDKDGKTVPFKDLYNGPNVARRVLVIFIRHFFCGVSFHPPCTIIHCRANHPSRTVKNSSAPSPPPSQPPNSSSSPPQPSSPSSAAATPP